MLHAEAFHDIVNLARETRGDFKEELLEWKNLLLRSDTAAEHEQFKSAFFQMFNESKRNLDKLEQLLTKMRVETPLIKEISKLHNESEKKYQEALTHFDLNNPLSGALVDDMVGGLEVEPSEKIDQLVALVVDQATKSIAQHEAEDEEANAKATRILITVIVIGALVGGILTYWIVKGITAPLRSAVTLARTVASGDLSSHIEAGNKSELGELQDALRYMNSNLQQIIGQCRSGIDTISTASGEIASGNLDLSARTEKQAASLQQTAASMEELTSTVKQNADNARQANQLAASASGAAIDGGSVVSKVVTTMASIHDSSRKIVDIIAVIDGIAFQTNILALNAAVEAARAGEQGRGFAVVASEVRNLAQRSASAAKEIKSLIDDSVTKVDTGNKLVAEAGTTMAQIVDSVKRVSDIMAEITAAGEEQSSGIEQVNQAIGQMDQVTQQNAALVEEAAAAAESMKEQAATLTSAISVFKLDASGRHDLADVMEMRHELQVA